MYIRAHVLVEATTVLERGGFGAGRVCISWFSRPTTLAPRVASRRLHHTVEHYITENDEPRVQSPGTLASLMCVMPLPRGECTAPATIYIPRNSRNRSHFVVPLSIRARSPLPSFSLVRPIAFVRVRTRIVVKFAEWRKTRDSVFLPDRGNRDRTIDVRFREAGWNLSKPFFPLAKRSHVYTGSISSRLFTTTYRKLRNRYRSIYELCY